MEKDITKAEFTAWVDTLAYRTKLNFIRDERKHIEVIAFDESVMYINLISINAQPKHFDFECKWLEAAFEKLPDSRKKILERIFVEGKKPDVVARELNCTKQHVYNQCSLAFKFIRNYKRSI